MKDVVGYEYSTALIACALVQSQASSPITCDGGVKLAFPRNGKQGPEASAMKHS